MFNGHPSDAPHSALNRGNDEDWDVIMGHVDLAKYDDPATFEAWCEQQEKESEVAQ